MNTKSNLRSFRIENGPNVDRILDGFKYAYDKSVEIPVTFVVAEGYTLPPDQPGCAFIALEMKVRQIVSISHECGNSTSLIISGNCEVALGDEKHDSHWDPNRKANVVRVQKELVPAKFDAYYDARTRKGSITFFI